MPDIVPGLWTKHKLNRKEFNFKECSIYLSFTSAKLLGQEKEELAGFLRSNIPLGRLGS